MQASGGKDAYDAAILQMFTMYRQQYPKVPEQFWTEFKNNFGRSLKKNLLISQRMNW